MPDIDIIVIGCTHHDKSERWVTYETTGRLVLLAQPKAHTAGLTETVIETEYNGNSWHIEVLGATPRHT